MGYTHEQPDADTWQTCQERRKAEDTPCTPRLCTGLESCKDLTPESDILLSFGTLPHSFFPQELLTYPSLGTVKGHADLVKTQLFCAPPASPPLAPCFYKNRKTLSLFQCIILQDDGRPAIKIKIQFCVTFHVLH